MENDDRCLRRTKPPLETGIQTVYRPFRKKPRKFRPSDLARVYRYVACENGPKTALCAVLAASGRSAQIAVAVDQVDVVRDLIRKYDGAGDFDTIKVLLISFIGALRRILESLKSRRFLRYIFRRLLIFQLISELIDSLLDFSEIIETLVPTIKELEVLLRDLDCREQFQIDGGQNGTATD